MKEKIIYITVAAALIAFSTIAAQAQNLDPTVEVSREYEGRLMEVHKPAIKMNVPDSVYRFDLDFDYSVSDTPYKGAYEFSPYTLEMKPAGRVRDVRTFYLNAGAGYQLRPVLDVVWTPDLGDVFRMDVYGTHRSFIGNYIDMSVPYEGRYDGEVSGCDLDTKAGIGMRYDWQKGLLRLNAGYAGLVQQDGRLYEGMRTYNALDAALLLRSKMAPGDRFGYGLSLDYRYATDRIHLEHILGHELSAAGFMKLVQKKGNSLCLDLGMDMVSYAGAIAAGAGNVSVVPHYVIERGLWHFDLGVKVSKSFRTDPYDEMYRHKEQVLYPDIKAELRIIPSAMKMYLNIGGGNRLNTYSSLLERNRRIDFMYGRAVANMLEVTDERVSASMGLEGRIGSRFSYDLKGGFRDYGYACHDAVVENKPAISYAPFKQAFAEMDWLLDGERLKFDGSVRYAYSWGLPEYSADAVFLPAAFSGDVAVEYNWKKRIYAGVDCRFATARSSRSMNLPGYADLGVCAEYIAGRCISVWGRGGNLLDMNVQDNFLYAEKGPYFTVGICLNL